MLWRFDFGRKTFRSEAIPFCTGCRLAIFCSRGGIAKGIEEEQVRNLHLNKK